MVRNTIRFKKSVYTYSEDHEFKGPKFKKN